MNNYQIDTPEFATIEEEAEFWDNFDTGDYMPEDADWIRADNKYRRRRRIAILPDIASQLEEQATRKGVSVETLINVLLADIVRESSDQNSARPKPEDEPADEPVLKPAAVKTVEVEAELVPAD